MLIIPAIDLKDGRCVRLRQGRAEEKTVYSEDPVEVAQRWAAEGAGYLHIVDLDGAFQGHPVHTDLIKRIVAAVDFPVEVGGGLREDEHLHALIDAGVSRVIVGTRALAAPDSIRRLVDVFGQHLAVGIDARDGMVQVKGWVETTGIKAPDLAEDVSRLGVTTLICTDTATDGMMLGTNVEAIDEVCRRVSCRVIASGGVHTPADVQALRALGHRNLEGVIVGKALYEGGLTLAALAAAGRS